MLFRFVGRREFIFSFAMLLLASFSSPTVAQDSRRFAFVVTNQNHAEELMPLKFPHSDGSNVSAALKELGFDVRLLQDGTKAEFQKHLANFLRDIEMAGPDAVAFFYFSGHAWADINAAMNFLILNETWAPARKALDRGDSDQWRAELLANLASIGVPMRSVTKSIGAINTKASFVIIDSHLDVAEPALIEDAIQPAGRSSQKHGMMLVAQGRPGLRAADSNDFSKALAGALLTPGLDAQSVFKQVQLKVAEVTNGKQVPWIEDRLLTSFSFSDRSATSVRTPTRATELNSDERERIEIALWNAVKDATDPRFFRAYLEKFPSGNFADVAKLKVDQFNTRRPTDASSATISANPVIGRRVALVVGNSDYKNSARLANPASDARAMAEVFRALGFDEVHEYKDLEKQGLLAAFKKFGDVATSADWAVVYYAGHGLEVAGTNYFVPIDAKLEKEADTEDEAVPVKRLFDRLGDVKGIKIVILDACRDNPLAARSLRRGGTRGGGSRGLASMPGESGTLIALAADPGMPAYDGEGVHSPYAQALLKHITEPNLEIRMMFGKVYDTMRETMSGKQEPWIQAKLSGQVSYQFRPK
jgi:uncharacterized caspase-like protein